MDVLRQNAEEQAVQECDSRLQSQRVMEEAEMQRIASEAEIQDIKDEMAKGLVKFRWYCDV